MRICAREQYDLLRARPGTGKKSLLYFFLKWCIMKNIRIVKRCGNHA